MESLMHNQTIRITAELEGIYRVVLNDMTCDLAVLVRLDAPSITRPRAHVSARRGKQKKKPQSLCGKLIWVSSRFLTGLMEKNELTVVEIERENFRDSQADTAKFEHRRKIMHSFLQIGQLIDSILEHRSIGPLVSEAMEKYGVGRYLVYKCWSLLCRHGFSDDSLRSRFDLCGARGSVRDCSPDGRKKPGRKTMKEKLAINAGTPIAPTQPGMNIRWRQLIMIADKKIPAPKPKFEQRFINIIENGFIKHMREEGGKLTPDFPVGSYPNRSQVRRVLKLEIPRLQQVLDATTKGHFARNKRGLTGKSKEGAAGPGHTWAIDSTIGDIYLRSSINRKWVIGRPIVYVIVDVWSTAVVGFYVCMRGPSWDTAKVALFNAVADPALLEQLWGFPMQMTLHPYPTLPFVLLCDRGEYHSQAAKVTAFNLLPCMSYTPPYRPDLKGVVEVMHRIEKDYQCPWTPGAIDARRAEFELRKFDPHSAVFTVQEYVEYLYNLFCEYNLTADRRAHLDVHMIADGVIPTPAGLWRWGHEVGIGVRRALSQTDLIKSLLPEKEATVTRTGISFSDLEYRSAVTVDDEWTATARNFGRWQLPAYYYPGSASRIWTPNIAGAGLLELGLTDQANASPNQTFEEIEDAFAYSKVDHAEREHRRTVTKVNSKFKNKALVDEATKLTEDALAQRSDPAPSLTAARQIEVARERNTLTQQSPAAISSRPDTQIAKPRNDAYLDMMRDILGSEPLE